VLDYEHENDGTLRRLRAHLHLSAIPFLAIHHPLFLPPPPPPRYTRADEQKIKDLTRELERLTAAGVAKARAVEAEATETSARQVELDKIAAEFRALHAERAETLARWQEALEATARRDGEILAVGERFAAAKATLAARRTRLDEEETRVRTLEEENRELDGKIDAMQRSVGAAREGLQAWTARVDALREKVELLKADVSGAATELATKRAENESWRAAIEEKERGVLAARKAAEEMKARAASAAEAASSAEESFAKRAEFLKKETARVEKAEHDLALVRDAQYKAGEAVTKLKADAAHLETEIVGARRTIKNLADRLRELDDKAAKQTEHV
jgi:coiled-coil domain-containing protein 39